jgi:RNA polymerase sigma-70 factor (ECF subfamily)
LTPGQHSILEFPLQNVAVGHSRPDAPGFDAFLRDHYQALLRFLRRRTASEQDAEDAAQESLARLLRYRESQPPDCWKPLLFRIAANVAHDQSRQALSHRRKAHVSLHDDHAFADAAVDTLSPDRKLADARQLALVLQAIRRLPEKCRHVFLLSRFHGMSNQAIADRCGISVRMVEKQITKALAACRTTVRDYGA